MQPVTCANVEDIMQQFCLVTLNEDDALIFDKGASKPSTHNLFDLVGQVNSPLLESLSGISEWSQ
eukprot:522130-Ditylum_brightwellii.AAC.1